MAIATPISPPPVDDYRPGYLPAYLSNGVFGLRVGRIPQLDGLTVLNGFAGVDSETGVESFARTPYPLAGDLEIDGRSLSDAPECASFERQGYDFSCGELHTRYSFDAGRARARLEVTSFCSRTNPMLLLQEVSLEVDRACDVRLVAGVEHAGVPGSLRDRRAKPRGSTNDAVDGSLRWESQGGLAQCGLAYHTELAGVDAPPQRTEDETAPLCTSYAFRARTGRRYRLRQISGAVCETTHHQPDLEAVRLVYAGYRFGWERLREENRRAWDELWEGRIVLTGAPTRWQALADAAYFYLHTSVHSATPTSTSMFGLAYWPNYHYYRGHVMWDIETFVVPPLILTQPDAARTLLEYRSDRIRAARHNASMRGYRGLQFPWESSIRHGEESSPGEGSAAAHEHHVSTDVAVAFAQFVNATHDWEWGRERAWPILQGVAEWVVSRGKRTSRGFEICDVGGIAEKERMVDNNAFVNMGASIALRAAADLADRLGREADATWRETADNVYLPVRRDGVIANHDRYRVSDPKGETPEAAAGLFPLGFEVDPQTERATLEFYVRHANEYAGAPMLSAVLGVFAARTGDRARALDLFERGYASFVVEPFSITTEYGPERYPEQEVAGPFAANLAGFLLSCLCGLPGIRIGVGDTDSWCTRPVTMPAGWDGIEVERIWARGRSARLVARHGDPRATIERT
jgi:protein-glucosylgalactosylhydroxylysine glucosidase